MFSTRPALHMPSIKVRNKFQKIYNPPQSFVKKLTVGPKKFLN